jgi:hypothetical protein
VFSDLPAGDSPKLCALHMADRPQKQSRPPLDSISELLQKIARDLSAAV